MRKLSEPHAGGKAFGSQTLMPRHQPISGECDINHKDAYHQRLQAQLQKWEAGINSLQAEARQLQSGGRSAPLPANLHPDRIADLRSKLAAANARLTELQHAEQDDWIALQESTERLWDDIGDAMNSGNQRFE